MFLFDFLRCWNVIHHHLIKKIANCIIQLLNSGLKNARKIIRILFFLSNADVSNKFAKFNVLIKKDDQQDVFLFTQLKLNMLETRKSKN